MFMFDWFYKNVTDTAFTYSPFNFSNLPASGVMQMGYSRLNETAVQISQPGCPPQIVDCLDINVIHNISYATDNCVSMLFQCGHQVKQEFTTDVLRQLPSTLSSAVQQQLFNFAQSTTQWGEQLSQAWLEGQSAVTNTLPQVDSIASTTKSLFDLINPVNIYQQHSAGWMDYIGGYFGSSATVASPLSHQDESGSLLNPANLASRLISFATSYFEEAAPEKIICPWDDFSCHQEAFGEAMQACSNEEKLGYLQCALNTLQEYASQYDASEIYENMQENYLPSATVALTCAAAITGAAIAITAIRRYNRAK